LETARGCLCSRLSSLSLLMQELDAFAQFFLKQAPQRWGRRPGEGRREGEQHESGRPTRQQQRPSGEHVLPERLAISRLPPPQASQGYIRGLFLLSLPSFLRFLPFLPPAPGFLRPEPLPFSLTGVQEFGVIGEELYSRMDIEAFLMIVRGFQPAGARAEGRGGEVQVAWGRA